MSSAGVRMGNSVGDMTTKQQSAAHAEPIGVMPHFRRLLRSTLSKSSPAKNPRIGAIPLISCSKPYCFTR